MTDDTVDRLLAEYRHLPRSAEVAQDALRWAILIEDVLGITLTDEQITSGSLMEPDRLREILAASPRPG